MLSIIQKAATGIDPRDKGAVPEEEKSDTAALERLYELNRASISNLCRD